MFKWLGNLVDSNDKALKKLQPVVAQINALEPEYGKLTDDELKAKTHEFRDRLAQATADAQNRVDTARQELQDVKKRVAEAQDKFTLESGELAVKQAQNVWSRWKKNWQKHRTKHWMTSFLKHLPPCVRHQNGSQDYVILTFK